MTEPGGPATSSEIVFYQGEDGRSRIQVRLDGGTVWLTQRLLAELFQKDVRTINEHLQNIFEEGEADPAATIRKFRIVQTEGSREVTRLVDHYNLDVILAVGYRVRSHRGTQFRRWATERLTEYVVKGFVMDDERLKEGRSLGTDYFDELLERIREIRASEKRFYQKIRDLYALAIDYDASTNETKEFFQIVQNKLHWAITGSTAAEIIAERASADKPNMGLTTWKGTKVRKADVTVAKNYLNDDESVADRMRGRSIDVFVHHSSVSLEERRAAEERFAHGTNACIVCTSTLELGIDVGDLDLVFQANAPSTVSSFMQRMGRTGRRAGTTANTTFLCEDPEATLQAVALIELAREGWVERVANGQRCWPVLVHQLLALSLQWGAISAERCWEQLTKVPDFRGITRAEFDQVVEHMKREDFLYESGGLLSMGQKAERVYGKKNFLELYAIFSSPVLYRVVTAAGRDLGSLEQDFVDRLVEQMSSFLLGGRAWTVERVSHDDRVVVVREAPGGVKPSWGGFIPQHLGFEICQRMKKVLTDTVKYPYVDDRGAKHIEEKRGDLGDLLRRSGHAVQIDGSVARWWTFAGGRINHTLKYGFEVTEGWKVVADNFQLRVEGDGVSHESVRQAIAKMASTAFWDSPDVRRSVLARLPGYRLSKFQDCLPERFALEVIENYVLDVAGTVTWLDGSPARARSRRPVVELKARGEVPPSVAPALHGHWTKLPARLSVDELNALAHFVNGYTIAEQHLDGDAFQVAEELRRRHREHGGWDGNAVELLAAFFAVVRGWRGLYDGPHDGDEHHVEAQSLYEAVVRRLREHPEEVEFRAAPATVDRG